MVWIECASYVDSNESVHAEKVHSMTDDGSAARASTMFGDYDIIETVGQGGMGIVYRATDTSLGRTVALKVLKDDLRSHKAVVARFRREAQAYASLNHPNIVQIYSVGAVGGIPYIAMELVDGDPLSKVMKRERRIPWERALAIGEQIAEALGSAHEAQIIHRDIKPGNVIITRDGHAYVTDFGIAKVLTAETQLTVDGSRLGTPQYMSPERCQNAEITFSSDLYSLGVVLFQMVTGRLPYESNDTIELIRKIVSDPPRRVSDFMPDIPEDVERLIAYLLEKKVENRPASAHEWIYLCNRVREGKSMVEDDSGLESSLKSFRDSQPTPATPIASDSDLLEESDSVLERVRNQWNAQSLNVKTVVAWGIVSVIMGMIGLLYTMGIGPATANDLSRRLGATRGDWSSGNRVASFYPEMPGVTLVQLNNLDWLPDPAGWIDASSGLVHIVGRSGSAWEGRRGLVSIRKGNKDVRVVLAPTDAESIRIVGLESARATAYVELSEKGSDEYQLYGAELAADGTSVVRRQSLYNVIGKPARDAFSAVEQIVFLRSDNRMIVIGESLATPGESGIYVFEKGKSAGRSIVPPGMPIGKIAATDDESRVAFSRHDEDGNWRMYTAAIGGAGQSEELVSSMLTAEGSFAVHPSEELIAVAEAGAGNVQEVVLYSLRNRTRTLLIPNASDVRWHPSGVDVIALAPDLKDVNQLWQVSTADPHPRKQLTFLEDGVSDIGRISNDGKTLLATTDSDTKSLLVVMDLEQLASGL